MKKYLHWDNVYRCEEESSISVSDVRHWIVRAGQGLWFQQQRHWFARARFRHVRRHWKHSQSSLQIALPTPRRPPKNSLPSEKSLQTLQTSLNPPITPLSVLCCRPYKWFCVEFDPRTMTSTSRMWRRTRWRCCCVKRRKSWLATSTLPCVNLRLTLFY